METPLFLTEIKILAVIKEAPVCNIYSRITLSKTKPSESNDQSIENRMVAGNYRIIMRL